MEHGDQYRWWDNHKRGRNNRPAPGSTVKGKRPNSRGAVWYGTVWLYEGQWHSTTFPVKLPDGRVITVTNHDITECSTTGAATPMVLSAIPLGA